MPGKYKTKQLSGIHDWRKDSSVIGVTNKSSLFDSNQKANENIHAFERGHKSTRVVKSIIENHSGLGQCMQHQSHAFVRYVKALEKGHAGLF